MQRGGLWVARLQGWRRPQPPTGEGPQQRGQGRAAGAVAKPRAGGRRRRDGSCRGRGRALPITHHRPAPGAGRALGRAAPTLPAWAIGKLWPELFLSAFDPCFVACKALKRQMVTSTDLLFLLVWKQHQPAIQLLLLCSTPSLETPGQAQTSQIKGARSVHTSEGFSTVTGSCMLNKRMRELRPRMLTPLPTRDGGPQPGPALTAQHGTRARQEHGAAFPGAWGAAWLCATSRSCFIVPETPSASSSQQHSCFPGEKG